ncbi:RNA polymerase sigma factor [Fontisphaera persica]|uniref:RNA polymerase sigma factor n=1 Tax=Fontisphaera persica TaxID=2974023 RepID=UPI0024C04DBE|nr:RNA polymerase sigma factor [Fontisphaera persica]WCJ59831.1 RNA polymerase sigma factor [Fontisphaera persica]
MDHTQGFDVAACLAGVRRRDEQAARQLVEFLHPLVMKIVRAHLSPRLQEEDLAQEIFAKVFNRLHQYRGQMPLEHWVARVAVNTCRNALRALRVRPEVRWADLSEDEAQALTTALHTDEPPVAHAVAARDLVEKLLETLAPEDRLILVWLDMEERSVAEISQLTGWSEAMIKVRAFRARRKLRKQLARLMQ